MRLRKGQNNNFSHVGGGETNTGKPATLYFLNGLKFNLQELDNIIQVKHFLQSDQLIASFTTFQKLHDKSNHWLAAISLKQ